MRHQPILLVAAFAVAGSTLAIAEPITPELAAKHEREVAAKAAAARGPVDVFFAFGSATLATDATKRLTPLVRWAERHPSGTIILDGHADPRGTEPYNIRLSARRAEAVRDLLLSLGVAEHQIVVGLFGESAPRRATFAADRRVTATLSEAPLYEIVDRKLDGEGATALLWEEPVTIAELEGPAHPAVIATR